MLDIIELQHQLNQNKEEAKGNENIFISRTARRNNDIDMLLKRGSTPCQVSEILGIPIGLVQPRVAELEREEANARDGWVCGYLPLTLVVQPFSQVCK